VATSCPEACRCLTLVSLGATLPDACGARLKDTACYYVSEAGDEQSTTVGDVRLDAVVGGLPVRPIRSFAGQRHYPGLFWSVTTGKHVWYESLLERDRLLLADYDRGVVGIATQPMWLVGNDNGVTRRHVRDLLLALSKGSFMLVDVKPAEFAEHPKAVAVFGADTLFSDDAIALIHNAFRADAHSVDRADPAHAGQSGPLAGLGGLGVLDGHPPPGLGHDGADRGAHLRGQCRGAVPALDPGGPRRIGAVDVGGVVVADVHRRIAIPQRGDAIAVASTLTRSTGQNDQTPAA
jgi:hypothetical protein